MFLAEIYQYLAEHKAVEDEGGVHVRVVNALHTVVLEALQIVEIVLHNLGVTNIH